MFVSSFKSCIIYISLIQIFDFLLSQDHRELRLHLLTLLVIHGFKKFASVDSKRAF